MLTGSPPDSQSVEWPGAAGDDCDDLEGWTVIDGDVRINKNKATFRNVAFLGPVEVHGNNVQFIHCCFGGVLVLFGNNTDIEDLHDGDGSMLSSSLDGPRETELPPPAETGPHP